MKLDLFIKSTLMNIANGIHEANENYKKLDKNHGNVFCMDYGSEKKAGTGIHFDLIVTSKMEGKAEAGADFNIYVIDASVGAKTKIENESINKISFSIALDHRLD